MYNIDILAEFNKFIGYNFLKHRGFVIERSNGGYVYAGCFYQTIRELDKAIDEYYNALERSINRIKSIQNVNQKTDQDC